MAADPIVVGTKYSSGKDYGIVDFYNLDGGAKTSDLVYTSAQLNAFGLKSGDKITKLAFKGTIQSSKSISNTMTAWVGFKTGDITWNAPDKTEMQEIEVYGAGEMSFVSGVNDIDINLDEAIVYDGTSDLRIYFEASNGGWVSMSFDYDNNYQNMKWSNATSMKYNPLLYVTLQVEGAAMEVLDGTTKLTSGDSYNFGLALAGTTKEFTLKNDGTEAAPVAVAHTGNFGVELSAASIPAGGEITLTVTMPTTSGSDEITISSSATTIEDFVLNVTGTVRDASKCFASFTDGSQPADWTTSGNWNWASNYANSGNWYADNSGTQGRLISPLLIVADGEKFVFEAALNYSSTYNCLTVEYSANGTDWTASETVLNVTSDAWQWFEVSDIPAGAYYIALHACRINIRNFYGGTLPAVPSNVQVSNLTDAGVTITWDASGSETAWQVNLVGGGDNKFINVNDIPSLGLTNLEPNTTYTVKVRVEDGLAWTDAISFKTLCGAELAPVQWGFGDATTDAVPDCWDNSGSTSETAAGSTSYFIWGVYYASTHGENMLRMYNYNVKSGTALINTPRVILPTYTQELAFDYSHRASCGDFTVKISTDNGANWTDLQSFGATESTSTTPGEFVEATISLAGYEGETIMLQFYAVADYNNGAIFIDNISIQTANPCATPKNVFASNITNNSAVLAWTEKGEATKWNIQLSENGEDWFDAATGVEANPYTITGLNPTAVYSARVQAVCSESSESNWSDASATFTTLCDPEEELPITESFESSASPSAC